MKLLKSIYRIPTLRNLVLMILFSFVVVVVMTIFTQTWVYEIYGDVTMPDTQFVYAITEISEVFGILGQEGPLN